ncbi:MAG TPA: radical SAM protein [Allosphingosinicella sp.]
MRVTIIDFVERGPTSDPFKRRMSPSFANVMPQAIAVWCEQLGHDVRYICYTGYEDLAAPAADTDLLIAGAYTQSALTSYAVANIYRSAGAITALGGPHARCYPEHAARHFDYVLGFTGRPEIDEMLREAAPHRPLGRQIGARRQPAAIPSLRERWKFAEATLAKAGPLKIVPMLGSMGCPYSCSFCIDATVPYQPLDYDELKEDLRFVRTKYKSPLVGWHDPNFGVRFNDYLGAMEEAVPPGSVRSIAEMSMSLLTDENLDRLKKNGFVGMLPGIESWYDYGNKSKTSRVSGMDRVRQIADHINRVQDRIPFVQSNFILGLDCDSGPEPFELTKRFIDLTPGVYPAFSLFTCYGRASPLNLELQRAGRVNAMPFHVLDSNHGMNIVPLNYEWTEFYDLVADVTRHAYDARAMWRRFMGGKGVTARLFNLFRGATSGRPKYQAGMARMLRTDPQMRRFFDGETRAIPPFFEARIRNDMGIYWEALPEGALDYEPNAYAMSEMAAVA